ncbi:MAG: tetratricopeptide repeat protein [Planctomycetota bacterium]
MLIARGNEAYAQGDYERALASYDQASDRRPGDAEVRYQQGRTLLALDRPEAAREALTIATDLEPENPLYRDALFDALAALGDQDALYATIQRLFGDAASAQSYLALGKSVQRIGLPDEAERAFAVAAGISDASDPEPYLALAALYREIGDTTREIRMLRVVDYLVTEIPSVQRRIRALGEVPGPTFRRAPRPELILTPAD